MSVNNSSNSKSLNNTRRDMELPGQLPKNDPMTLGTRPIGKLLLEYSIPAIIASVAVSVYNIVDSIFIGRGVGPMAIAGLAITPAADEPGYGLLHAYCGRRRDYKLDFPGAEKCVACNRCR